MNIQEINFPTPGPLGALTSGCKIFKKLLSVAKERGFDGNTKYNDMFSQLFFSGGKFDFKKDIPEDFIKSCVPYLKGVMMSFDPKHEEKEAVCALLLSELCN